jgi:hypothetical protein
MARSLISIALVAVSILAGCGGTAFTTDQGAPSVTGSDDAGGVDVAPHVDAGPTQDDAGIEPERDASDAGTIVAESATRDAGVDVRVVQPEAAPPDAGPDVKAPTCKMDLSGVGTGDFQISFTIITDHSGLMLSLLSQRADCACQSAATCSQPSDLWAITAAPNSTLGIVTDANTTASFTVAGQTSGVGVGDGLPHKVLFQRISGYLSLYIDGVDDGASIKDTSDFGTFPPLAIGTSPCDSNGTTAPLAGHGTLTDICITD